MAVTVIGIVTVVFFLVRAIPGDPAVYMLGDYATKESVAALRAKMGLDLPLYEQYARFLANAFTGDLGSSVITGAPALDEVWSSVPPSAALAVSGIAIAVLIGVPLGVISAARQGSWTDLLVMVAALLGISFPVFWLGLVAILTFANWVRIFPALGAGSGGFGDALYHLALPALVLGVSVAAYIARLTRSAMLEVLGQDYIRTARAKGLGLAPILFVHALKNASVPIVTVIGLGVALLIGGAVVTESVFAIPGIGRLVVDAILRRDYPVIQGVTLLFSVVYVLVNLLVDLTYSLLDPRIRQ